MKKKVKQKVKKSGEADGERQRKFDAALAWLKNLDQSPHVKGVVDLYADDPHAGALNYYGGLYLGVLKQLAKTGHPRAVVQLVRSACDLAQTVEDIADSNPNTLVRLAERRPDWPVLLCRHESSNKLVSGYLDKIHLGEKCAINADGKRVAKYSLRTPINRYVWRKLKGLPLSIMLMSDLPEVKAIDLRVLPKLTKATAKTWADKALMPYISAMYGDFSEVPEFRSIISRPGIKTRGQRRREIRKDVIRALQSLAPNDLA